jgi:hypothetical protein
MVMLDAVTVAGIHIIHSCGLGAYGCIAKIPQSEAEANTAAGTPASQPPFMTDLDQLSPTRHGRYQCRSHFVQS